MRYSDEEYEPSVWHLFRKDDRDRTTHVVTITIENPGILKTGPALFAFLDLSKDGLEIESGCK